MPEQEVELERVYTIPLARAWITARHRRTRRAVNMIREFAIHHMKSSEIKIDTALNEELWKRGITKPPRRITVKMEKDEDGVVTISLPKKARPSSEAPEPETTGSSDNPKERAAKPEPSATTVEERPPTAPSPKTESAQAQDKPAKKNTAKKQRK